VSVNGRRLRGLSLAEARTCLRNTPRDVELVVARVDELLPELEHAEETDEARADPVAITNAQTPTAAPLTGMRKFSARRSSVAEVGARKSFSF
jgi:hypothetical protein